MQLLEYANTQLLEFRHYDDVLTRELARVYDSLEKRGALIGRWRLPREASRLQTLLLEVTELTERVDNARKVADELRTEYQKAGIAEAVTVGQVEIVDHATLPMKPAGIGLAEQLALGLLVGLMLGAGGAFVAERVGSSIARRAIDRPRPIPPLLRPRSSSTR